jgi:leader peptidase (prepilin peptidase)/N-methyltransferase
MGRKKNRKKQKEEKEQEQAYPLVPFLFAGMLIGIWIGG